MAFGFAARTSGLIVDSPGRPESVQRFLFDFARAYADSIAVAVAVDPAREAEAEARARRLSDWYPDAAIVRWRRDSSAPNAAPAVLQAAVSTARHDLLITLDPADRTLAHAIGAAFVPCFPDPALCRDDFESRSGPLRASNASVDARTSLPWGVCLFGPESTGKSTLAALLARHYRTLHVTEYVRGFLDATGSTGTADDVPWIARGQRAAEIATAHQAGDVLICDTNLATIMLWSDVLFGGSPAWLRDAALAQQFDLWLLTDIDVPFEPDRQRCFPGDEERAWLMRECKALLERLGVTPVLLSGSLDARMRAAVDAIDRLRRGAPSPHTRG
jgi:nicotinamide riboside kinase